MGVVVTVSLPWPPSVNHYWRAVGGRVIISRGGRAYRGAVCAIVAALNPPAFSGRIACEIIAYPPDARRRDLDNILKAALDAMQHAGMYADDGQIDKITIERREPCRESGIVVTIREARE